MTRVLEPAPLLCHPCLLQGQTHRAWTVSGGTCLCVRCAVERHAGEDDMLAHDLVATLYERLRLLGHPDAF